MVKSTLLRGISAAVLASFPEAGPGQRSPRGPLVLSPLEGDRRVSVTPGFEHTGNAQQCKFPGQLD